MELHRCGGGEIVGFHVLRQLKLETRQGATQKAQRFLKLRGISTYLSVLPTPGVRLGSLHCWRPKIQTPPRIGPLKQRSCISSGHS
eukprot:4951837-Amphidinium_carterae.1